MKKLTLMLFAAFMLTTGCTSDQVASLTETGLILADKDPEKAREIGQAAGKVTGALGDMPYETERAIGGGIAVKSFASRGPLYPSDELQRYVNLVGRAVARQSTRPEIPYSFAVVQADEINAWAAPGGYIFITSGALKQMQNEAQLAGVLAHEVYHVTDYHMVKMLKRGQFLEGAMQAADATTREDITDYTNAVDQANDLLFEKGLDQSMEFDSDIHGLELAAAAGYDPAGLVNYLENIRSQTASSGGGWLTSTHPSVERRIQKAREQLNTELAGFEGALQQERFQEMMHRTLR